MSSSESIRYASADDVLYAIDKDPARVDDWLTTRAKERAAAATQKWITQTGRAFHPVRIGNPDKPQSWEIHDAHDVESFTPVTVGLDNHRIMPIDATEGDTIEVRTGRDSWEDITTEEGDEWVLNYRTNRLVLYHRRFHVSPYDDPRQRVVRLTYRYGPLGEDTETYTGVISSVPADVRDAVAAKAAMRLALNDETSVGIPDDGQLTDRSTKRSALKEEWNDAVSDYSGFSTL